MPTISSPLDCYFNLISFYLSFISLHIRVSLLLYIFPIFPFVIYPLIDSQLHSILWNVGGCTTNSRWGNRIMFAPLFWHTAFFLYNGGPTISNGLAGHISGHLMARRHPSKRPGGTGRCCLSRRRFRLWKFFSSFIFDFVAGDDCVSLSRLIDCNHGYLCFI